MVERHFAELDNAASVGAPKVRHLIQRIVWLQLGASLLALVGLTFEIRGAPACGTTVDVSIPLAEPPTP